jgi:cytochrome c oxidase subunit 3/cytochrome o ubiquinol oxidase subunit 3
MILIGSTSDESEFALAITMTQPASELPVPPPISPEQSLNPAQWGMASFLLSEVAFFGTLIVTYVAFMGKDVVGPTPAEALSLPLVLISTICLLSSSLVIHLAERSLNSGQQRRFCLLMAGTIALGIAFLLGTAVEWRGLIHEHHLTISRNLFGTTYYTLVGFHGLHVTFGVVAMLIVLTLSLGREVTEQHHTGVQLVAWYWHFVDAVWIVVFLVVYVASRNGVA